MWFVDLAPVADQDLVAVTVADALGVSHDPGHRVLDAVVETVGERSLLVLLDNCEHVIGACAKLADALLRGCQGLALLATTVLAWDEQSAAVAGRICRRLDGIPLAMRALAEERARSAPRDDPGQAVAADEMLYAALESRIKEALWIRDTDLALDRANEYVALSPSSARGYMHRADVLFRARQWTRCRDDCLAAARLAPPHADEAMFLLGQCYEKEHSPDEAIGAYLSVLRADPLAISAAERLAGLAQVHERPALRDWATGYLNHLLSLEPAQSWPAPYRDLPAPQPAS